MNVPKCDGATSKWKMADQNMYAKSRGYPFKGPRLSAWIWQAAMTQAIAKSKVLTIY